MNWTIPGTVLEADRAEADLLEERFRAMFLGGGVMLGQVTAVTGLDPYMVQNWVKRGFLSSPQRKRYTLRQLCRILNINMLRGILQMEDICGLLSYVNGALDDESDDLVSDADLYFMFVRIAARTEDYLVDSPEARNELIRRCMADYREPVPGAGQRVEQVLRIMMTAYAASMLQKLSQQMLENLK